MSSVNYKNLGPLIINIDGISLQDEERTLLKHDLIGGIILFSHNYKSKTQLHSLINDIKSVKDNILITIDHEGGRVQRLINDFTHLPSFEDISNIKNHDEMISKAYDSGYIGSLELSEIGIDINYSPVVDINHDKSNRLLKGRTFGKDIKSVIALSDSYIRGCIDGNILPVLKHFPGHGRVTTDSHTEACVSNIDYKTLSESDILPFKEIHSRFPEFNIPIMTNHLIYTEIDEYITTYSKKWLYELSQSIFTNKPFFISDDIEMYSATKHNNKILSCERRVLLALSAGCRMIIATTMQDREIIKNKESYKYITTNYITTNIIEHYEKNRDNMLDIKLPRV